jgi:hypothetical protein
MTVNAKGKKVALRRGASPSGAQRLARVLFDV